MIIECPVCDVSLNIISLKNHFRDDHYKFTFIDEYSTLLFKIHEKIDMLQLVNQPYALRLLESLLDNEEKK